MLPDTINLFEYPWMRVQALQRAFHPSSSTDMFYCLSAVSKSMPTGSQTPPGPATERLYNQVTTFGSMRLRGLQEPKVMSHHTDFNTLFPGSPLVVDLDWDGNILVQDGTHRIVYAILNSLPELPATVRQRHPSWVKFVENHSNLHRSEGVLNFVYQKIPHPDFNHLGCQRTSETRVKDVLPVLDTLGISTVVDLGCNSGSFAVDMAASGYSVLGIDNSRGYLELARWLSTKYGTRVVWEESDILAWTGSVDLVCALSVLHHVLNILGMDDFKKFMTELTTRCKYLLVESPVAGESASAAHRRYAEVEEEVMASCGFLKKHSFGVDTGFKGSRCLTLWAVS